MRILINAASTHAGGGIQVAKSIIEECVHFPEHKFFAILSPRLNDLVDGQIKNKIEFQALDYRPAEKLQSLQNPAFELEKIEARFKSDVVFTTSGPAYWRPKSPHLMGFNLPHYLYPDSPFFKNLLPTTSRFKWYLRGKFVKYQTLNNADAWVVQTDDINSRLRKWINSDQVFTVTNTISSIYQTVTPTLHSTPTGINLGEIRLLVLSAFYVHKNLELVDQICDLIRLKKIDGIKFLLTLQPNDFTRIIKPENRFLVENLGPLKPQDCPRAYQESSALFLPTLLECFSASYVEAMAMQRPVITTDLGFARTICGDAAVYFQPLNPHDALQKILLLNNSSETYHKLVTAGQAQLPRFGSATDRMRQYIKLCSHLVNTRATN